MRIVIPHNTDKSTARRKIEQRLASMIAQYSHYLNDSSHRWDGDTLHFSGSAKGLKAAGTVEITDSDIIVDGKLPLIAKPFEPRIKHTLQKEAESLFPTA
jgi:hypothetical protein